jgi:hypothetical protein
MAINITGLSFDYQSGASGEVRFYADQPFLDSDGVLHPAQAVGGREYIKAVAFTAASGVATCATFTLPDTEQAATDQSATISAVVFGSSGRKEFELFSNLAVPASLGPTITYTALLLHNDDYQRLRDTSVYTKEQVNLLIAESLDVANPATTTTLGSVVLDETPASSIFPSVVTTTSPRLPSSHLYAALAGISSAVTGTIKHVTDSVKGPYRKLSTAVWVKLFGYANVMDFGASWHTSSNQTTGGITNGTATLVLAAAKDYKDGQYVSVAGAGAAGVFLVAKILSGGGTTTLTLDTNASATVVGAVVRHDSSDAFIGALAAVFAAGGGKVFVPSPDTAGATYFCNKTVDATSGGVIYPPQNAWTGGLNQSFISLALVGEVKPSWGDYGVLGGGVVIQSLVVGSGTLPAILSAKAYSASYADNTWNYVDFHVENILFRTYDNPTLSAVNLGQARRASVRNVIADVGVTETTGSSTAAAEPTNNSVGIILPKSANNGQATVENCTVTGYRFGFQGSDHFRAEGFVMAARCLYGFAFTDAAGIASGTLYSYRNLADFFFTGSVNVVSFTLQSEVDTTSNTWSERNVGTTVEWSDTGNVTKGAIWYIVEDPVGVAGIYTPTITGMSKVDKTPIDNGKPTTLTHVYNSSGTISFPTHIVADSVVLSGGTATVTLTGAAVFTDATTYQCTANDVTAANAVKVVKNSGTSITFTGTGTDIIAYICVGK